MPFELPQDTESYRYSRYDRLQSVVTRLASLTGRADVTPDNADQFSILEEKFWLGVTILVEGLGSASPGGQLLYDTVADLKLVPTASCTGMAVVLGESAPGVGLSGFMRWDPTGTDADNPLLVIRPNDYTTGGVWRQFL